jgi:subtilase family serine protease
MTAGQKAVLQMRSYLRWQRQWAACLACAALLAGRAEAEALLTAHVPEAVASRQAALMGAPDVAQRLHLAVALPMRDQAGLDALLRQIYDPVSPLYRHYLSVSEFAARFGPAAGDYEEAVRFFADAGLLITGVSANHYIIDVVGNVADIERVFHVKMGLYRHPTEARVFLAPNREPTLDLAVPVLHVAGMDDFVLPTPRAIHSNARSARARTGSGPNGDFIGSDIRAAYYGSGALTGAGQSLGLMELAAYNMADVTMYFANYGPPLTTAVNGISTDGTSVNCTKKCNDGEQALDIEYAISMAPGLDQVQVYVGKTAESVLNRMASDNTSKQLSTSWGWHEDFATDDPIFKEMAAQGQTFLTASGDDSTLKASGPWPEEDANLTAVGGTDLRTHGAGGRWSAETGWADSAGGPSVDKTITIKSYQLPFINSVNAGSTKLRNVPDIAGDADTDNFICAGGKCDGGWGGTSFASPIWAGFIALANQQAATNGKPTVGFLNPTLYALAGGSSYHSILHDETKGKSGIYSAVPGYDLVTGLGSPSGQALIDALVPQVGVTEGQGSALDPLGP